MLRMLNMDMVTTERSRMSRYCGDKDSTEIIKAVDIWKDKCLLHDGSIFSDDEVWTPFSLSEMTIFSPKIRMKARTRFLIN